MCVCVWLAVITMRVSAVFLAFVGGSGQLLGGFFQEAALMLLICSGGFGWRV